MANERQVKLVTSGGGYTDPIFVVSEITLTNGLATVTAASLGLARILGFAGSAYGATTGTGLFLYATTSISANVGVTSIALECIDDGSTLTTATAGILFWGTK